MDVEENIRGWTHTIKEGGTAIALRLLKDCTKLFKDDNQTCFTVEFREQKKEQNVTPQV